MTPIISENGRQYLEVACPQCYKPVRYYDIEGSECFGCTHCHTFFHKDGNGPYTVLKTFVNGAAISPKYAFGDECQIDGRKYIVTGLIEKHDPGEDKYWREYMLFNPAEDYYYVFVDFEGEWYLVWKSEKQNFSIEDAPPGYECRVVKEPKRDRIYEEYACYKFEIVYACGEFDTNILEDENNMVVTELATPPHLLVSEFVDNKTTWYRGKFIPTKFVKKAFKNGGILIDGDTFVDPTDNSDLILKFSFAMAVLLLIAQLFIGLINQPKQLMSESLTTTHDTVGVNKLSPIDAGVITVHGPTALVFNIETNLSNEWLELPVSLVDEKTGRTFEFTKVVEYYSGVDGGESWSEGSRDAEAVISSVPSGDYRVNLYPNSEVMSTAAFTFKITENGIVTSNILLGLLIILAYPIIILIGRYNSSKTN